MDGLLVTDFLQFPSIKVTINIFSKDHKKPSFNSISKSAVGKSKVEISPRSYGLEGYGVGFEATALLFAKKGIRPKGFL